MTPKKHADMIFDMIPLSNTSTKTELSKKHKNNDIYTTDLHGRL